MSQIAAGSLIQLIRTHRTVVAVCVTTAITMMGQGIISPVLPLIARDYGVGLALVGFTVAVFGLGRLFSNLPAGFLSER